MKRFFNQCGRHRQNICLLAAGALPEPAQAEAENHLAECAGCRQYYNQTKRLTLPLADWERNILQLEPSVATRSRWAEAVQAVAQPKTSGPAAPLLPVLDWLHDMIWPCRRIWGGLAAVWLVILAVNLSLRDAAPGRTTASARPSPEVLRAFLEREGLLAQSNPPREPRAEPPPKPSAEPPRSERRLQFFTT